MFHLARDARYVSRAETRPGDFDFPSEISDVLLPPPSPLPLLPPLARSLSRPK